MSRPVIPSTPTPDPSAIDASLHLLVHQLAEELSTGALAPSLLHVAPDADGVRLGLLDLDGAHPSTHLLGFVAPDDWYALGSATAGYAYDVGDRGTLAPRRRRVHTVVLLSRSGELAHRTVVEDDPALGDDLDREEITGEQVDLLRLALGLATPPPPCGTDVFWTIEWLSAVLGTEPSTWSDVARSHPALALLAHDGPPPDPDAIVDAAGAFVRVCTWRRLREMVVAGRFDVPELAADDARWLDEGAFARFVLTRCPPLSMLRRHAIQVLPAALGRRLESTLHQLGVPEASWPDDHAA